MFRDARGLVGKVIYTCGLHTQLLRVIYMLFLQISKHTAESCPMHNEKVRKISEDLYNKSDKINKKYGIKVVGMWTSMPDHTMIAVFDAPSMEALLKQSMEPEIMAWMGYNTIETKPIMAIDEAMKLMK